MIETTLWKDETFPSSIVFEANTSNKTDHPLWEVKYRNQKKVSILLHPFV